MPYIPPQNRPYLDARVDALAEEIATTMSENEHTAELSTHYRQAFGEIAGFILKIEGDPAAAPSTKAEELAGLNNVSVGEVISISEVIAPQGYYAGAYRGIPVAEGMGGGGAGPISPGELELAVQLQITYAIE